MTAPTIEAMKEAVLVEAHMIEACDRLESNSQLRQDAAMLRAAAGALDELAALRERVAVLEEVLRDSYSFIDDNVRMVDMSPESGYEPADQFSYEAMPLLSFIQATLREDHEQILKARAALARTEGGGEG